MPSGACALAVRFAKAGQGAVFPVAAGMLERRPAHRADVGADNPLCRSGLGKRSKRRRRLRRQLGAKHRFGGAAFAIGPDTGRRVPERQRAVILVPEPARLGEIAVERNERRGDRRQGAKSPLRLRQRAQRGFGGCAAGEMAGAMAVALMATATNSQGAKSAGCAR